MTEAEILTEIINNCDPIAPAGARFYEDCTAARGGDAFARDLCKELAQSRVRIHQLFTGHIGGGKSSELKHLADRMNIKVPLGAQKRFFPVIVNVLEYVEENNGAVEFVLLAAVEELAKVLRRDFATETAPKPLPSFIEGIRGLLLTPIRLSEIKVTGAPIEATFTNLRSSPTAREIVLDAVRGNEARLRESINEYLKLARDTITAHPVPEGEHPYTDLVLILDGMDRIETVIGRARGGESHRALFIDGADDFISLDASVVYTAPLSLIRSEGNVLGTLYARDPFVLPMVKTEERAKRDEAGTITHPNYETGRETLTRLLQKRMPPGVALASVITDDALDFLLKYSGGHIRSLLRFMRDAALKTDDTLPIVLNAAQQAIRRNVGVLVGGLNGLDWDYLAELETSEEQLWNNEEERHRKMLEDGYVYEYVNGGEHTVFTSAAQWYAVNPIVRELNPFKSAVEQAKLKG